MTSQPSRASRLKRVLYSVVAVVAIIALLIGIKTYNRAQTQPQIRPRVIAAVRANFPDFCTDGEILAEPATFYYRQGDLFADYDPDWGIRCTSWMQVYYGDVTIINVDECTTIHPIVSTFSEYYNQYEDINKSNGQKLAVCP